MGSALYDRNTVNIQQHARRSHNGIVSSRQTDQRPECGTTDAVSTYNLPLHVFALFLILTLSFCACAFPIAARRIPSIPVPRRALFISRHFGTGVLLATAFVHLLPTAFTSLTDPCLSPFWNEGYPAMAGFIAMVSVFVVVGIEMFFATKGAGHSHESEYASVVQKNESAELLHDHDRGNGKAKRPKVRRGDSTRRFDQKHIGADDSDRDALLPNDTVGLLNTRVMKSRDHLGVNPADSSMELNDIESRESVERLRPPSRTISESSFATSVSDVGQENRNLSASQQTMKQQEQRALLQVMLLEAGILFHSVFIGMAVSVAVGTPFIVLLIAISFHQTFEGLALGSRIAAITAFPKGSWKPWLMALAYGTTTPIGQAIGLVMHNLYDPRSETGLLMVGIMNAISSGLLLFAGLVELLAEDFLSEKSYDTLHGAARLEASAAVVAGSMLMALVGAWA